MRDVQLRGSSDTDKTAVSPQHEVRPHQQTERLDYKRLLRLTLATTLTLACSTKRVCCRHFKGRGRKLKRPAAGARTMAFE